MLEARDRVEREEETQNAAFHLSGLRYKRRAIATEPLLPELKRHVVGTNYMYLAHVSVVTFNDQFSKLIY